MQQPIEIIPNIKVVSDASDPDSEDPSLNKKLKNRRLALFLAMFFLCLSASLAYVWLREPIFQSTASLLTVSPEEAGMAGGGLASHQTRTEGEGMMPSIPLAAIEQQNDTVNPQHVTLHRQILLGVPVFEETLRILYEGKAEPDSPRLNLADLRSLLSVDVVKETNLVEMKAQGPQPKILAPLVNAWIDAYQTLREQTVRNATSNNYAAFLEESKQLEKKIEGKRAELEQFRAAHDILSRTDSDNTPMMRLKGLNEALNKATDDQVKTRAKLDSIRAAIARGEPVMPPEEGPAVANLEKRALELREILKDQQRRFTPTYRALHPQMKLVPEQLAQVEAAIKDKTQNGSRAMLSQAGQAVEAAEQSVVDIRQKIVAMKRESAEFTNRFAEQETMRVDLQRLEEMHRDLQAKLAKIEARPEEPYPPLQVVERAYPPIQPVWPHYWRDSGISLVGSLLFALLFIWLYDYLTRIEDAQIPASAPLMPSFQFYSVQGSLPQHEKEEDRATLLQHQAQGPLALENPHPRELTGHETLILLEAADANTLPWIGLLLSGLSVEEICGLREENFDWDANRIKIEGAAPRSVPLAPRLKSALMKALPGGLATDDAEEVSARVACAAFDSGLSEPESIDAAAIRHTYIAYLVRQGIRLSELERIVGRLQAKSLAAYGRLSPPGPGLPAERVPLIHTALLE